MPVDNPVDKVRRAPAAHPLARTSRNGAPRPNGARRRTGDDEPRKLAATRGNTAPPQHGAPTAHRAPVHLPRVRRRSRSLKSGAPARTTPREGIQTPSTAEAFDALAVWVHYLAGEFPAPLVKGPVLVGVGDLVAPDVRHWRTGVPVGHVVLDAAGDMLFLPLADLDGGDR